MAEDSTPLDRPSLSADRIRRETPENKATSQDNQHATSPFSSQTNAPALAPKSLSRPGPTADVVVQDASEGAPGYSHSTCTATAGLTSGSSSYLL